MSLTKKEKIRMLQAADHAFWNDPHNSLYNSNGLCAFFRNTFGLNEQELKIMLGKHYASSEYTFGDGHSQGHLHRKLLLAKPIAERKRWNKAFNERHYWCQDEIDRLKGGAK